MRLAKLLPALLLSSVLSAQTTPRFIEVQVRDTVRLPFAGIDIAVRMPSPLDLASQMLTAEEPDEKAYEKALSAAATKASATEKEFLELMKANNFTHRLKETEHAEDYLFNTGKKFDVNTYLVQLKGGAEMEKYHQLTLDKPDLNGTPEGPHFGDPDTQAPRLMRKLYDHARLEAEALTGVAGGRLGKLISAQEIPQTEGSFFEQLLKLEKGGNQEEAMMELGSTHTSTMAFRFELLD